MKRFGPAMKARIDKKLTEKGARKRFEIEEQELSMRVDVVLDRRGVTFAECADCGEMYVTGRDCPCAEQA